MLRIRRGGLLGTAIAVASGAIVVAGAAPGLANSAIRTGHVDPLHALTGRLTAASSSDNGGETQDLVNAAEQYNAVRSAPAAT
jgi:hypothetical protein